MTKKLLQKFIALERDVVAEKGRFILFALFLREYAPGRWDFVVSAPWVKGDKMPIYRYFATQLQSRLDPEEMVMLARIVLIDKDNPGLEAVHEAVTVEHGLVQIWNREFFGLQMERAYIITSTADAPPVEANLLGASETTTATAAISAVFTGTRVPVDSLIVHLKSGISLEEFIEDFPSVNRQQAVAFLEMAERTLLGGKYNANLSHSRVSVVNSEYTS